MAKALLRELGYEVLLTSSYFEYYPDAIPCEGASGQCTIDCDNAIKVKENKILKEYLKRLAAETNSLHTLFEDWDNTFYLKDQDSVFGLTDRSKTPDVVFEKDDSIKLADV